MKRAFLSLICLCIYSVSFTQILKGKVVSISDGDTFTLLLDNNTIKKIRLYGVDCPEKGQDFGNAAKKFTSRFCYEKRVTVIVKGNDRYRRTVGIAVAGKDTLNIVLLKEGLAWHFNRYDTNLAWEHYEEKARLKRSGLWSLSNPIPPWEWRKMKRSKTTQPR